MSDKPEAAKAAPPPGPPKPPPPKNPGFVTCTIDGNEVVAKPGTNMIEAARQVGVEIPYFCYHSRLSVAANCRMCLVEASNAPKLVPACQTPLAEGVAIKTCTPKVKGQQRAVMELLLLNHPVDCSICDQAGECKLQDYYMRYDHQPSRLEGGKVLKNKRKVLGPLVVLDQERCILCTRCVRFMSEVAKEPQLGVFGRGSHERIDVFPGAELDSNYSGNVVDVCPVGALLNRDFRFRARAWFLSAAPSVCTGCSRGCNTYVDFMGQTTYRYRPRENEAINKSWLCDQGRLSYRGLNQARVETSSIGRGADRHEVSGDEAAKYAALKLKPLSNVAVLVSPHLSNEDLLATLTVAREQLGAKHLYVGGRADGAADTYLMTADKNPNRRGLEQVARAWGLELRGVPELIERISANELKALWAAGVETPDDAALALAAGKLELFVCQASHANGLTQAAHVVLATATHVEDEGTFTQVDGHTQRFRQAYPPKDGLAPHWRWAQLLSKALGGARELASAREVFRALASSVPELATFDWEAQAPRLQARPGLQPMPTAADGRPPGYREFGAPRVRGQ